VRFPRWLRWSESTQSGLLGNFRHPLCFSVGRLPLEERLVTATGQAQLQRGPDRTGCPSMMRYTSTGRWMFFNLTLPMLAKSSGILLYT
jgi:hypothetical protein